MSAFSAAILATSVAPTLYHRYDETSGTTASDASTGSHPGTYNGGVTLNQPGLVPSDPVSPCVLLNGSSGYVSTTFSPFTVGASVTIRGRAYRTNHAANHALIGGSGGVGLRVTTTQGVDWFPNTAGGATTWAAAWPGDTQIVEWMLVHNDAAHTASLYINGVLVSTQTGVTAFSGAGGTFMVGARGSGIQDFWNGNVDEVSLHPGLLTATDATNIKTAATTSTVARAHWTSA